MVNTPIVMISYNRPELVKLTMRNVSLANGAKEHEIFMFIDGPRSDLDKQKQDEIFNVVSEYKKKLPKLTIIRRERNYGCKENIVNAVTDVISRYRQAMIIEDDILISRTFLEYMDAALDLYREDERIWSINAYQSPYFMLPKDYSHDVYLNPVNLCWGWGTWYDRWCKIDFDLKDWPNDRENKDVIARLNKAGRQIIPMIEAQFAGRLRTWDVQCTYYVVKNGLMSIEPIYQLSKNIGFADSIDGEHCKGDMPIITRQKYYNFKPRLEKNIAKDERINNQFEWITNNKNFVTRVMRKLRRIRAVFSALNMEPENV